MGGQVRSHLLLRGIPVADDGLTCLLGRHGDQFEPVLEGDELQDACHFGQLQGRFGVAVDVDLLQG